MEADEFKCIQEKEKIVEKGSSVLLVGCGNADFVSYLANTAVQVYAIELPDDKDKFEPVKAAHRNVHVVFGSPADVSPAKVSRGNRVDILIHLVPTAFFNSVKLLEKELEVVRPSGRVFMEIAMKGQTPEDIERSATTFLESIGLSQLRFFKGTNSVYVLAVNKFKQKTLDAVVFTS